MSMYTHILSAALSELDSGRDGHSSGESWNDLLRLRDELGIDASPGPDSGWDPSSVAIQIAYDAALITFARRQSVHCEIDDFDKPQNGRARLESELMSRGFRSTNFTRQSLESPG